MLKTFTVGLLAIDDVLNKFIQMAVAGRSSINVAILSIHETPFGVAQTDSFLQKVLQH